MTANATLLSPTLTLACELIRRPSVTPLDEGCQEQMTRRLAACGFSIEPMRIEEVDNFWASHGSDNGPVLCFAGHTDVVPTGPREQWHSDPFEPDIRDGRLHGRGAADMKASVAAMVVMAERFVAEYPEHAGTLALLLTSDEEGDAIDGVRRVADLFRQRGQAIDWCITGEPSSTEKLGDLLRVGRRGSLSGTLTVKGVQGHVAYPQKARNPIHQAMPALAQLAAKRWDEGYESFPPTSLQISNINAGTGANNVIPGELQALFNLRYNPHWNAAQLESECEAVLRAHGLEYAIHWHRGGEPFHTPEGPLRDAARELAVPGEAPPAIGLHEGGYLYLATQAGEATLRENHALQKQHGADVALLSPQQLAERFPWLALQDVVLGSLGLSGEGWFDGYLLLTALRKKAQSQPRKSLGQLLRAQQRHVGTMLFLQRVVLAQRGLARQGGQIQVAAFVQANVRDIAMAGQQRAHVAQETNAVGRYLNVDVGRKLLADGAGRQGRRSPCIGRVALHHHDITARLLQGEEVGNGAADDATADDDDGHHTSNFTPCASGSAVE